MDDSKASEGNVFARNKNLLLAGTFRRDSRLESGIEKNLHGLSVLGIYPKSHLGS